MQIYYSQLFKKAWSITWRNKILWFFGLFATLIGAENEYGLISRAYTRITIEGINFPFVEGLYAAGIFKAGFLSKIVYSFINDPFSFFILLFVLTVFLAVFLFIIWLVITSQVALINSTFLLEVKKPLNFKKSLKKGLDLFAPVLALNVAAKLIIYSCFTIIGIPLLAIFIKTATSVDPLVYLLMFILFIPFIMVVSFLTKYATAYIVYKKTSVLKAIENSWKLFRNNWIVTLELALFLYLFHAIITAITIILIWVILPQDISLPVFVASTIAGFFGAKGVVVSIISMLILLVAVVLYTVFVWVSWSLMFIHLNKFGRASGKVHSTVSRLFPPKK